MEQRLVPQEYFMASGVGQSDTSVLNAFDRALVAAGISQCNLVPVSSVLPKSAKEVKPKRIEPGQVTFVVMGKATGKSGDLVSTGVAIGYIEGGENDLIVELDQDGGTAAVKRRLSTLLDEMANARGVTVRRTKEEVCELKITSTYGVAVAAVVLLL